MPLSHPAAYGLTLRAAPAGRHTSWWGRSDEVSAARSGQRRTLREGCQRTVGDDADAGPFEAVGVHDGLARDVAQESARTTHTGSDERSRSRVCSRGTERRPAERTCRNVDDTRPVEAERLELLRRRDPRRRARRRRRGSARCRARGRGGRCPDRWRGDASSRASPRRRALQLKPQASNSAPDGIQNAPPPRTTKMRGSVESWMQPTLGEVARPLARVGTDEEAAPRAGPVICRSFGSSRVVSLRVSSRPGGSVVRRRARRCSGVLAVAVGDDLVVVAELGDRPRLGQTEQLRLPGVEARLEERQFVPRGPCG